MDPAPPPEGVLLHAVRWWRRCVRGDPDWTRWHLSRNADVTLCGQRIPLAIQGGSFLPETDEDPARATCRRCRRVHETAERSGPTGS